MPFKGVLIRNIIFLSVIFIIMTGCCTNKRLCRTCPVCSATQPSLPAPPALPLEPFTPSITLEVGKDNIENFQFYISETMILKHEDGGIDGGVYEIGFIAGTGFTHIRSINDTIIISSNTEGIFESISEDEETIYISFDEGLNIMFNINYGFGGRYQWLGGTVEYMGHFYNVDFDELNPPILLIKMDRRRTDDNELREAQGRVVPGRSNP
ncbi:MAG: hypothetical protein FWD47_11955 [Treponema sp.]|nr:hypothetical protein [Treponema sp.]